MDLSWVELMVATLGFVFVQAGTYSVLKHKVMTLEKNFVLHEEHDAQKHSNDNRRIDAGFKRIDVISDKVIILEQDSKSHLDLPTAEEKFITRKEIELHFEKIEIVTSSTNDTVQNLVGKFEDLTQLISTNIVNTLSAKGINNVG